MSFSGDACDSSKRTERLTDRSRILGLSAVDSLALGIENLGACAGLKSFKRQQLWSGESPAVLLLLHGGGVLQLYVKQREKRGSC